MPYEPPMAYHLPYDSRDAGSSVDMQDEHPRERMLTDTSSYVVDISAANLLPPPAVEQETSITERHRQESSRSLFRTRKEPTSGSDVHHDVPSKRRSQRFSFSRRTMKGQSLPAGRPGDTRTGLPGTSASGSHGWEGLNSVFKGLHSSKAKKEYLRMMQLQRSGSSMGCAEYDPDLVVDTMSFAQTPDVANSAFTSADYSNRTSPEVPNAPVHAIQVDTLDGDASATAASPSSDDDADVVDDAERDRAEREEERDFLRALGLEFDAIARRVEEQT